MKTKRIKPGHGWAWLIKFGRLQEVCHWAQPDRKAFAKHPKPTAESELIKVAIVPWKDYQKLIRRKG